MGGQADTSNGAALRVGLWLGSTKSGNQFVDIYANALRDAGATIVDITRPLHSPATAIDIFHIHWPDQIYWARGNFFVDAFRTILLLMRLKILRSRGTRIVWMVHNLDPHDLPPVRAWLWRRYKAALCRLIDGFMTVSPGTLDTVMETIPALRNKPYAAIWHPLYPALPVNQERASMRTALGVPEGGRLYGSLGYLRPYKGIEKLITVFRNLDGDAHRLLIAGKPIDAAYLATLKNLAQGDPRIILIAEPLDDVRYADMERACDFIVLPFSKTLHSGSLIHAVSAPTAAITPRTPFSSALRNEIGADWVHLYDDVLSAEHLEQARMPEGAPWMDALEPATIGRQAADFYRGLLSN